MQHTKERLETAPTAGVSSEIGRLKENSSATMTELREFLRQHQGKSPQELLGAIATSGLVKSIAVAAFLIAVLLAALTVGPYYMFEGEAKEPSEKPPAAANSGDSKDADGATKPAAANTDSATDGATAAAPTDPTAAAAAAMGLNDTKTSAPDKNPREGDLENLLDGVK